MLTRFDKTINIYNNKKNNHKIHKRGKHTKQRISDCHPEPELISNNIAKSELSQYEYKNFLQIKSHSDLSLKDHYGNIRVDLALAIITKNVIDEFDIKSDSEQKVIFDKVQQAFKDGRLPIKLKTIKNQSFATRSSIEECIECMINLKQVDQVVKLFNKKKTINQKEKLDIFLNTFSKNILNMLPDILIGQKGNLRHGFADKSIQIMALKICLLSVLIDNFSNGSKNNTQEETERRAQSKFNYMLVALLLNVSLVSIFWLARKKDENLQEDLELLSSEFDEIIEQRTHIRNVIDVMDNVIQKVHSDHNYYFYSSSVDRNDVEQIAKTICNENILNSVIERLYKAFELAGTNKISLESFKNNIELVLDDDYEKYNQLGLQLDEKRTEIHNIFNRNNDTNSCINNINAINDFIIGYPKHLSNKVTEPFGIRFFERKHTRESLILSKGEENTNVSRDEMSTKNGL